MLRLYSDRAAERIIRRHGKTIRAIAARYALPTPVLKAVLFREITQIDLFDPLADLLVRLNMARLALFGQLDAPPRKKGLLYKLDSSTGYAQIFGRVAIDAVNFALDRRLTTLEALGLSARPERTRLRDLRDVWRRLNRDTAFNLELAALNLLSAAEEKTGRIAFDRCSPEELKRIFTRYNGTSPTVSPYGEAAYRDFLRYQRGGQE